jgi:hypothetical protein
VLRLPSIDVYTAPPAELSSPVPMKAVPPSSPAMLSGGDFGLLQLDTQSFCFLVESDVRMWWM